MMASELSAPAAPLGNTLPKNIAMSASAVSASAETSNPSVFAVSIAPAATTSMTTVLLPSRAMVFNWLIRSPACVSAAVAADKLVIGVCTTVFSDRSFNLPSVYASAYCTTFSFREYTVISAPMYKWSAVIEG